jgi:hypothetical protein
LAQINLRDDGMSYGDYVEQRTCLLFLKMADERTKPPYKQKSIVPKNYDWPSLIKKMVIRFFSITGTFRKIWEKEKVYLGLSLTGP